MSRRPASRSTPAGTSSGPTEQPATADQARLDAELLIIWARNAPTQAGRLERIEAALARLDAGAWDATLVPAAVRAAHQLAGVLGAFGRAAGSRAASDIEHILASGPAAGADQRQRLHRLVQVIEAELKRGPRKAPRLGQRRPARVAARAATPAEGERVDLVVVDDDQTLIETIAAWSTALGYSVRCFGDGETALEALGGEQPRLRAGAVLLDVDLPGLDGFAVLRQLHDVGVAQQTPVVMLTGRSTSADVLRALDYDIGGYVAKPVWLPDLLARMGNVLESKTGLFVVGPARTAGQR